MFILLKKRSIMFSLLSMILSDLLLDYFWTDNNPLIKFDVLCIFWVKLFDQFFQIWISWELLRRWPVFCGKKIIISLSFQKKVHRVHALVSLSYQLFFWKISITLPVGAVISKKKTYNDYIKFFFPVVCRSIVTPCLCSIIHINCH